MTNHVHLLMTFFSETSLSKAIQMLGRFYVQYFNHCYRRTGTLWEGRYKATLIDSESYLLTCMRYIDLNPVRAGISSTPEESEFTSARDRARAHRARQQLARAPVKPNRAQRRLIARARADAGRDRWLAPIHRRIWPLRRTCWRTLSA